jgi:NADPH2:quinone reductase
MERFGPPEVLRLGERPEPEAAAGQVVVDVRAAGITFVETQVRAGRPPHPAMAPALPAVLGNGVAGHVAAVGAGVDPALVGRRVISTTGGAGGYAERAAVPVEGIIHVPPELTLEAALAVLADGRTALSLLRAVPMSAGQTALVLPAGGGVGPLLVQLLAAAGVRVIALAGGELKVAAAGAAGAALAVDSLAADWAAQVRTAVGPVDVAFDGVGGAAGRAAFELVARGGRLRRFGMASGAFTAVTDGEAAARGVTLVAGGPLTPADQVALSRAAVLRTAAGHLRPLVGQRFPLADAAGAHAAIEARATVGKTLLVV